MGVDDDEDDDDDENEDDDEEGVSREWWTGDGGTNVRGFVFSPFNAKT
jgi:hypothetical protein